MSHLLLAIVAVGLLVLIAIVVGALILWGLQLVRAEINQLATELLGYEEIDIEEARYRHPSNAAFVENSLRKADRFSERPHV